MGIEKTIIVKHAPVITAAGPVRQDRRWPVHTRPGALLGLTAAGLALEAVLLLGFLQPLSIRRNPAVIPNEQPLAAVLGMGLEGALRFAVPVVAAFAAFALALWCAHRLSGRAPLLLVLGGTLLFSLTLLPMHPLAAHDAY